eukprot:c20059_g1_i6.p2 GENE.c20059_g1_i6~~c20059_g1_i6.p2  ORF type:complete len:110 (+),score=20.59 c20059_g1_i6:71-400(+)
MNSLKKAIQAGDDQAVRKAIASNPALVGKTTNLGAWSNLSPLHVAIVTKQPAICSLLIELGADLGSQAQLTLGDCFQQLLGGCCLLLESILLTIGVVARIFVLLVVVLV